MRMHAIMYSRPSLHEGCRIRAHISKTVVDLSKMLISFGCVIICSGLGGFWRVIDGSMLGIFCEVDSLEAARFNIGAVNRIFFLALLHDCNWKQHGIKSSRRHSAGFGS